jgi:hypothetical protein
MGLEKLRLRRRASPAASAGFQVVAYRPVRRVFMLFLLALVVVSGVGFGYWLGVRTSDLDRNYLMALETGGRALETRLDTLNRELADARLAQSVDAQAAHSLRATISELRDRVAGLREEVTFYKNLMAPSSIERGLQIAEFELGRGDTDHQFTYRLVLTQAEEQRDWVQGSVELGVRGVRAAADGTSLEEVLPLTELAETEDYPLPFRFRYFQNLAGTMILPDGFRPRAVVVTVTPKGRAADRAERRFDWIVQAG